MYVGFQYPQESNPYGFNLNTNAFKQIQLFCEGLRGFVRITAMKSNALTRRVKDRGVVLFF